MKIKFFIITYTWSHEGLQQIVVFINIIETTQTHHKIGIEVKMTQRSGTLGKYGL